MSSIVDIIQHYQKSIDRSLNDEARLVHCIGKLYRLPVSVQHLQETGIGRTVNGLRKYDGEVGVAAKALVSKWKNMVAAEESDTGEPEPRHQDHEEEDEDNYDESCLQVDEDRHSDEHQEEEARDEEDHEDEEERHQHQEEESDNQEEEEVKTPQQATNGHDSDDHRSARSSHRDSDRHRSSSSSSKHKSDRHSHRSSSSSKDGNRSRDRHEKHRDGEKSQHHNSNSNSSSTSSSGSSKGHSSSPSASSTKKSSSRHESEGKEKKDKHSSSRKESSQANGKESSHSSSSKEKPSSSDKHHSKSKDSLNGFTKEDESLKRRRMSEDEEESAVKKVKNDQPSESKSKSSSKSSSSGSSSSKDRSSSKSASGSGSSKEKDKNRSSEKKKESSSKRKSDQPPDNSEDEDDDNGAGASFADALAMIGMPSTSKKKGSSKGSVDKIRTSSSSSMPPPPVKSDKHRSSSSSSRSSSSKRSVSPSSTASSSGYSSCSSTPALLAQKPKLAPLQIAEIVESLPMISPHYKPMPLNQTVMECVFSSNGKPQKRPMTEEEALGHSMQSKNLRTKVYSGVKTYNGEVPTLYNLCIRLLQEHIDLIDYTGGIPFDLLKPVLERASPDQLFTLENYNPYLMEDSDILWEQHCRRNFRSQKRKEEECEAWREMFIRCSEERETKLQSLTANIKQSQVAKAAPIRKTQLAYVDSAVKPPRSVISKQVRYGTAQAPVVSPAARVASLKNATTNVTKVGDSRLKVAAGIRDTAQAQVFHPTKPKKAPLMSKVMQSIKGFKGSFRR